MDQNFVEVRTNFSADLHPSTLRNIPKSFQSILDDLLLTYRERLRGIVLGYHDERIINKTAAVNAFYPYFHVDAEATLSVLRLEEGKHLGMLVLGAFNAVVHKDQLKGKFRFDKQAGVWVQCSDQTCRLKAGSMVKFVIQRVEASSNRFLIIGSMLPPSCCEYQPPGPGATPPGLGMGLAAGGAGCSDAARLAAQTKPTGGAPPAANATAVAATDAPPPAGSARAKPKTKRKSRPPTAAPEIAELLRDDSGADVDGAAAAVGGDAAAAVDADDAVAGEEAGASAAEDDYCADPPKPKKRKKKKKSRLGDDGGAADEAVESDLGARTPGSAPAAVAAAAVDTVIAKGAAADAGDAAAAPKKRKGKAGTDNGEHAPVKKHKKKKARATEPALEGAAWGGDGDAAEQAGKKRKKRQSRASDATGEPAAEDAAENGAGPTYKGKKRKKSRKISGADS